MIENKTFRFDFKDLKLTVAQVENILGYNEDDDREFVSEMIEETLKESQAIANIKAEYRIFSNILFDNESKSIVINHIGFNVSKIVFGQIKKSESAAIFLCTAGEEVGKRSRKAMQERDLLKGYIYDVIGTEIVESAADLMQSDLEKSAGSAGRKITNRYSPGYCGWNVAEQHKLFDLFPDNFCEIRLTPSALMDPVKSVSGIIGIGEEVRMNPYTCKMCDMKDCFYRKAREKKIQ
jgi:hypothetical protein